MSKYPHGPDDLNAYQAVMYEARLNHDPYDSFGWCQEWRFSIAEVLTFDMGDNVEGFSAPLQTEPEDTLPVEILRGLIEVGETDAEGMQRALRVLDKYREQLRIAGKDY